MEYLNFIEKHECLRTYFTEFPKKLHQLALEGRSFLKFSKKCLWIDCMELHDYLQSDESIFHIRITIMDFIETLHVLQFYRVNHTRGETCFSFINPNFSKDQTVPDDFYKQPIESSKTKILNGTRRLSGVHHIRLFDRLFCMDQRSEGKISKLQFARMQLKFALQKKLDLKRYELDTIHHDIEEPDYVKNQEIAGYYGNVELSLLKNSFGDYFPVYQIEQPNQSDETLTSIENEQPKPIDVNNQIISSTVNKPELIIDVGVEFVPSIKKHQEVPQSSNNTHIYEIDSENQPPPKRQCRSHSKQITARETNDALLNLQKEFQNFDICL